MKILILLFILLSGSYVSLGKSLCESGVDQRIISSNNKIARTHNKYLGKNGCTATLIGKRCLISAGHCQKYFKYLEFEVPMSNDDGTINHSDPEHIYQATPKTLKFGRGVGNDWAVFKVNRNELTGYYPGEIYGHYKISYKTEIGDQVSISGYGGSREKELYGVLQIGEGEIGRIDGTKLYYQIDTTGGSSGSSIINSNDEIVGIHSHGGCNISSGYYNKGTYLGKNNSFKNAILECLKNDAIAKQSSNL